MVGKVAASASGIAVTIDGLAGGSVEILGNVTSGFEVLGADKMYVNPPRPHLSGSFPPSHVANRQCGQRVAARVMTDMDS